MKPHHESDNLVRSDDDINPLFQTQKTSISHSKDEIAYTKFDDRNYGLTEEEWTEIFEGNLDLINDFQPTRVYACFFTFGIDDDIRGKVWCHLLHAEELRVGYGGSEVYKKFLSFTNPCLEKAMSRDKIADRSQLHHKPSEELCSS